MAAKSAGKKPTRVKKTIDDEKKYLCHYCLKEKKKKDFYEHTDSRVLTGITFICRDCVQKIALNWDENRQEFGSCTKRTVMDALECIDKPFLNVVWDASYTEWVNGGTSNGKQSIWSCYIKNINSMKQYHGLRWRDGDIFNVYIEDAKQVAALECGKSQEERSLNADQELNSEFEKNRTDVIRLLGYDPFDGEKLEDQPLLYSQLIGYLDTGGDGNDDMMRTSSAITIVRGFLQQTKLDDKIAKVMANTNAQASEMKTLLDAKKNISATISQLAEQSCLSLKHNKNASKGENTWTGKIKKLKELSLREAEVNGFDIGTCRGMQQVLEMSDSSIMKQLALDESEWSDMVAEQRKMLISVQNERDIYKEINRILLRENIDLRDTLEDHNLLDQSNLHDLKELFSAFGEINSQAEEDDEE